MLSNRPYLLRAFYQWIVDSGCTPILVVNAEHPKCKVPREYVDAGEIVFNISETAIRDMKMTNEVIEFKAAFTGVIHLVSAPVAAVMAVYAEENGEGIFFDADEEDTTTGGDVVQFRSIENTGSKLEEASVENSTQERKPKPFLRLVE